MFVDRATPWGPRDASREARIATVLAAPAAATPIAKQATFRVVAAGTQFEFTRTLVVGGERVVERFGPYSTRRAAHELAKRAAARLRAELPQCVVGVVDIAPEPEPPPARPLWEVADERKREAARKRMRDRYAKRAATPEGRAMLREKDRQRYLTQKASPEGLARLRERWRKRPLAGGNPRPLMVCEAPADGIVPTCEICGKPTRFYQGHAVRFCPKQPGEKYSKCQITHSGRVYAAKIAATPELKRAKRARDTKARRSNPRRYAAQLERERQRKARRRAEARAKRPADLPTGSVLLTASPRAPGHDLLAAVYAAVPPYLPPALRSEIISETAVLVLEGSDLPTAVAQASKSVRKNASQLRYTKQIDDCYWLADEAASSLEALL